MSMASVALSPVLKDSLSIPDILLIHHGHLSNESILIFLSVAGSVIPMHVLESDSVASVKLRIQNHKGFFVKNQKLVFEGRELARNDSCVRDYGVTDGTVLHLVLRLSNVQAITVRTMCGKVFEFHVERSRRVRYLKQQIAKKGRGFFDLKDQELVCDGEELEDQRLIHGYCKRTDAVIHLLVRRSAKVRAKPLEKDLELSIVASNYSEKGINAGDRQEHPWVIQSVKYSSLVVGTQFCTDILLEPIIVSPDIELPSVIEQLIRSILSGLDTGNQPVRSSEGSGGAYFMQDSSGEEYVSVFKPVDEEPMAINNPKGLPLSKDGEGLKKGTQVGGGALREVAAYILDHPKSGPRFFNCEEKGFAGVPPTVMVKCLHKGFYHPNGYEGSPMNLKIGSLQMYVRNCGSCEDMGPGAFPVEEVHRISVLDIRLANADRHAGNILVTRDDKGRVVLVPIDHGYCLPRKFEDCTFDWLYWPQAKEPYSPATVQYIRSLSAEEDIKLLKLHGWDIPVQCARILRVSTMLLKKGAERGLSPFAIGSIMCRETLKKESVIKQIMREAQELLLPGTGEAAFLEAVSSIMDRRLDELSS
ncbi:Phosphatidylinositol 4-kinase gamma 3 [Ancistrocladus abbreviatus]